MLLAGHKSLGSELKTTINVDNTLESNISTVPSPQFSDTIQELTKCDSCKLNVMYSLSKSTSSNLPTKINDDKSTVRNIFSKLSADIYTKFKPNCLGKTTCTSSRPSKIIFGSCDASVLLSYCIAKTKNVCLHHSPALYVIKLY